MFEEKIKQIMNGKVVELNRYELDTLISIMNNYNINTLQIQSSHYINGNNYYYCKISK